MNSDNRIQYTARDPIWKIRQILQHRALFPPSIPRGLKLYIILSCLAGVIVFFHSLFLAFRDLDLKWASLIFLTVLASNLTVSLPIPKKKGQSVSAAMGDVFVFLAVLFFGPAVAAITAVVEGLVTNFRAKVTAGYKQLFNATQPAIPAFFVGHLFYQLRDTTPPLDPSQNFVFLTLLLQIGICALAYFFLNTGMVSLAVLSLANGKPFQFWKENFAWTGVTHLGGACIATLIFYTLGKTVFGILIGAPIILLIYYAYKVNIDRYYQARTHLEDTQRLLEEKTNAEGALKRIREELEDRVVKRTADLSRANRQLLREIDERTQADEALAAEKDRLAVTLRSIGEGVITTDMKGRILLVNGEAEKLTGWKQSEARGQPLSQIFCILDRQSRHPLRTTPTDVLEWGRRSAQGGEPLILLAKDDTERLISPSTAPIVGKNGSQVGNVLVFRDVTIQRKMEEELLNAQKMESLSLLAGGVAHDFNNILAAILLKSQIGQRALDKGDSPTPYFISIEKAAKQASGVTQQLLTFAKGGAPIKKVDSIKELLVDAAEFCIRGSIIACKFELEDNLWPCEFDRAQINQVVNNLVINAEQAMPNGGTITVQASNFSTVLNDPVSKLPPGDYVRVAIKDEGTGIDSKDLHRIFEPFFTTKPDGHGLGLASVYSIIRRHEGQLRVKSKKGVGTVFTFYLPAVRGISVCDVSEPLVTPPNSASGRILVLDDDDLIRESAEELLVELGYQVTVTAEGSETFRIYKEALSNGVRFDAVILDLTIPGGMGGRDTLVKLLEIDASVKAIVSSGYSADAVMAEPEKYGFKAVLTKPCTIESLSAALSSVLANPSQTTG